MKNPKMYWYFWWPEGHDGPGVHEIKQIVSICNKYKGVVFQEYTDEDGDYFLILANRRLANVEIKNLKNTCNQSA